jgi:hypothetical protein
MPSPNNCQANFSAISRVEELEDELDVLQLMQLAAADIEALALALLDL